MTPAAERQARSEAPSQKRIHRTDRYTSRITPPHLRVTRHGLGRASVKPISSAVSREKPLSHCLAVQ
jgi:hypothetical protein